MRMRLAVLIGVLASGVSFAQEQEFKLPPPNGDIVRYHVKWTFSLVKPKPSDALSFEDESVSVTFLIDPDGISCNLRNKTNEPVTINWNNVSWVDFSGEAHKLIHSGIRLIDKEAPQAPTVIPPLARITDTMFPADHVRSTSSGYSKDSMWPDLVDSQDRSQLKKLEGAMFSVFMPLEVQGKTRNYNFVFTTKSVEASAIVPQPQTSSGQVSRPSILLKVEPEYTEEARRAKWQGTVVLSLIVDEQGRPQNLKIVRALGLGLDQKAIEAVQKWRYMPGMKDGRPVTSAPLQIEVSFRLP